METAEIQNWVLENLLVSVYGAFLILGGLFSLYWIYKRELLRSRLETIPLSHWAIRPTDFILYICFLLVWFSISSPLLFSLWQLFQSDQDSPGIIYQVFAGFVLQLGMLIVFLSFRSHFRTLEEKSLNQSLLSMGQSCKLGMAYLLGALPLILIAGLLWGATLHLVQQLGIDIELPLQQPILLFQSIDSPVEFGLLFVLAVIVAPVAEEFVFRAGVYRFLKGKMRVPLAMLISGLLFGLIHFNIQSFAGLVVVGIALSYVYESTKNIKVPIIFHALFNLNSIIWILLLPDSAL